MPARAVIGAVRDVGHEVDGARRAAACAGRTCSGESSSAALRPGPHRRRTCTSRRRSCCRAGAADAERGREVRLERASDTPRRSRRPPCGCRSAGSTRTTRLPTRSVIQRKPSGPHATSHGSSNPVATTRVVKVSGGSDHAARGLTCAFAASCAAASDLPTPLQKRKRSERASTLRRPWFSYSPHFVGRSQNGLPSSHLLWVRRISSPSRRRRANSSPYICGPNTTSCTIGSSSLMPPRSDV